MNTTNQRLQDYFAQAGKQIELAQKALAELDAAVEDKRAFLQNPFAGGLREELTAELLAAMPTLTPAQALGVADMDRFSTTLVALTAFSTLPPNAWRPENWQGLWAEIDPNSAADIVAFAAFAVKRSTAFVVGRRPNITPMGVPLYVAYWQAIGDTERELALIEADALLTEFETVAKSYRR